MNLKNTIILGTIALSISLLLSAQVVLAEGKSRNNRHSGLVIEKENLNYKGSTFQSRVFKNNSIGQTDSLKNKVYYTVQDSIKMNKDKTVLSLYGGVVFKYNDLALEAKEVVYNNKTQKLIAKEFKIFDKNSQIISTGNYAEFNLIMKD